MAATLAIALAEAAAVGLAKVVSTKDALSSCASDAPIATPFKYKALSSRASNVAPAVYWPPAEARVARVPTPISLVRADPKSSLMVSPAMVPVWITTFCAEPSNNLMLLWFVLVAISSICNFSWATSSWIDERSTSVVVPVAACTDSSRIRAKMSLTPLKAPSAVCVIEIASLVFWIALAIPRICDVMRFEIARPAASSLALLILDPVERRSMAALSLRSLERIDSCATSALRLVLITDMVFS